MRTKIILQDLDSQFYLSTDGTWVSSCQEARTFEHTYSALIEGLQHTEKRPEIVWCFGDPRMTLYISVRGEDKNHLHRCERCPLLAR